MGRKPCCDKVGLKKGPWTAEEDKRLINFILTNGQCCWRAVPKLAGLLRCGKSCRLRWTNYLRPDLKRGLLSENEEKIVIDLHAQLGNRWSKIASQLPGRTDNEIKNHWNTHIKKKLKKSGIDPLTHMPLSISPVLTVPHLESNNDDKLLEEADIETSIHSTITHGKEKEGENNKCKNDSMQLVNINDFSIDEVPLVDPCEILDSIISPPPSSSSSCSSTSCVPASAYVVEEDLDILPSFDWQCDFSENMCFWDDYLTNTLSFLMEDDHFDKNVDVQLQPPLP